MEKLKAWAMTWFVKKFLGEKLGQAIAKADGKRTWIGIVILCLLVLAKHILPLFVPIPVEIMSAIDSLILVVSGATGSFASIKAQKLWESIKQAGDEVVK